MNLTVRRTGGGEGSLTLNFTLSHLSSDSSDVSATPPYTSSQRLVFQEGVVELIFPVSSLKFKTLNPKLDATCSYVGDGFPGQKRLRRTKFTDSPVGDNVLTEPVGSHLR